MSIPVLTLIIVGSLFAFGLLRLLNGATLAFGKLRGFHEHTPTRKALRKSLGMVILPVKNSLQRFMIGCLRVCLSRLNTGLKNQSMLGCITLNALGKLTRPGHTQKLARTLFRQQNNKGGGSRLLP